MFHQLTAAYPGLTRDPLRTVDERWRVDPEALGRWQDGQTGVPIVDAGMRQLLAQGWMPNRARMIVASYLTKGVGLDWRDGARGGSPSGSWTGTCRTTTGTGSGSPAPGQTRSRTGDSTPSVRRDASTRTERTCAVLWMNCPDCWVVTER